MSDSTANNIEIKRLLQKFVRDQCSPSETDQVVAYFQAAKQTEAFPQVEEVLALLEELPKVDQDVSDRILTNILSQPKEKKPIQGRWWKYASIAALFIGVVGLGIFYQLGGFDTRSEIVVPRIDAVTLELDNGEVKVLDEKASSAIATASGQVVGQQERTKLTYAPTEDTAELVWNTLKVPYGKRFDVELSDGTTVYLNAGSSIRYPVSFVPGNERQVYLTGEAYLKVAKDSLHPFIVNADALNVQVLGTQFNVSNYPEDHRTDVVLVEGSVGMFQDDGSFDREQSVVLTPGEKGTLDERTLEIETQAVAVGVYTAWVEGELVFRNMSFDNILKKLERTYNITIHNHNKALGQKLFNASFKEGDVNSVLQSFQKYYGIDYTIINNEVNIN